MRYAPLVQRIGGHGAAAWDTHIEARRRQEAGEDIIFLTVGDPDQDPPGSVIEATVAALRAGRTGYSAIIGYPALRGAIAAPRTRSCCRTGRSRCGCRTATRRCASCSTSVTRCTTTPCATTARCGAARRSPPRERRPRPSSTARRRATSRSTGGQPRSVGSSTTRTSSDARRSACSVRRL